MAAPALPAITALAALAAAAAAAAAVLERTSMVSTAAADMPWRLPETINLLILAPTPAAAPAEDGKAGPAAAAAPAAAPRTPPLRHLCLRPPRTPATFNQSQTAQHFGDAGRNGRLSRHTHTIRRPTATVGPKPANTSIICMAAAPVSVQAGADTMATSLAPSMLMETGDGRST